MEDADVVDDGYELPNKRKKKKIKTEKTYGENGEELEPRKRGGPRRRKPKKITEELIVDEDELQNSLLNVIEGFDGVDGRPEPDYQRPVSPMSSIAPSVQPVRTTWPDDVGNQVKTEIKMEVNDNEGIEPETTLEQSSSPVKISKSSLEQKRERVLNKIKNEEKEKRGRKRKSKENNEEIPEKKKRGRKKKNLEGSGPAQSSSSSSR